MRFLPTALLAGLFLQAEARAQVRAVERVVAVVNDRVIMASDVMGLIASGEQDLRSRLKDNREELEKALVELGDKGMNLAIDRALILEEYEASKAQLPEMAVQERLKEIVQRRFNGEQSRLQDALAQERKTLEELRQEIRDEIVISMLRRQEVMDRVTASPADLLALYNKRLTNYQTPERVRMRLISIKKEGLPDDLVKKKVESVQAALASGKAFELVAQEFSDFAPDKGGDLGTVKKQDLRPDYLKAIEGLKPNQNAGPIDSEGEIAFLRLLQILPATGKSLEEVQPELERELRRASEEELYQSWVKRLRLKYPVVIYTPRE